MLGHVSSVEQVTDMGGGLLGCGNAWRWGNMDVSSVRCNNIIIYLKIFSYICSAINIAVTHSILHRFPLFKLSISILHTTICLYMFGYVCSIINIAVTHPILGGLASFKLSIIDWYTAH